VWEKLRNKEKKKCPLSHKNAELCLDRLYSHMLEQYHKLFIFTTATKINTQSTIYKFALYCETFSGCHAYPIKWQLAFYAG